MNTNPTCLSILTPWRCEKKIVGRKPLLQGYHMNFNWIKDWANRCNMIRQLDFNADGIIHYYLQAAIEKGHGPLGFQKLEGLHWKMNGPENMELHQLITTKTKE